jgi:hypothetical protein
MDKREQIEDARLREICPHCGKPLGDDRVGSGSLADGVFCSLACLSSFHDEYFQARRDYGTPSSN